jgi:PAS domain S-box-containing protein
MSASPVYIVVNVGQERAESHPRTKLLREAGYHVIEAATNEEAFRIASEEGPALLLLNEESHERFRLLADSAPALMWMNGPDGCEFVNREYLAFLGVTDTDVRGYDWVQFVHPADRKRYVTAYLEAVTQRRLFEATFRFRRHDGEYRWMHSIGTPRFGVKGEYLGYVGSTVDITNLSSVEPASMQAKAIEPRRVEGHTSHETSWLNRKTVKEYGIAVLLTLLALVGRFALDPILEDRLPYITFFMAVAVTSWYGGWGASVAAVVLGGLASNWFFMSPRHSFGLDSTMQQVGYATYFIVSLTIVAFGQAARRAKHRGEIVMDGLRREIRERILAEEQLASAKRRTEAILESVGEAIFGLNLEGLSTFINPAGAEMFGYRVEDLLGKNTHEILHHSYPDGRVYPVCECPIYASLNDGKMHRADDEVFWHKDGRPLVVSYTSTPVWRGERLTGAVVVLRDITERKRAEANLRESEARLRLAHQVARMGTFEWDIHEGVNVWTPELEAMYGLAPGEFERTQTAWENLVHPDDRAGALRLVEKAFETGAPTQGEWRVTWPDGSLHWLAGRWQVFKDDLGKPLRMVGVNLDITDRKEAEQALRRSEQQLELVSNSVPALIFYLDLDRRYRACNDAFTAWFGLTREQIIGLHVRELVGEEAWDVIRPRLDQAYAGETIEYEAEAPYRSGIRWIHAVYTPHRDTDGTVLGLVVLVTDITRSKQIEQALRDSEARLRAFAGRLEHLVTERTDELMQSQTRLRALATELNLAEQRERRRLATELHDHLQQTLVFGKLKLGQGKRLAQTMPACADVLKQVDNVFSDALQYTRSLVADLSPPVLRDHGLSAGLKWLGDYMHKHDMTVTVTVPEQEELALPEDQAVLLFQSVRELLINSSKYAGTGQATVTVEQHDEQLRIVVRDEGAGFEPVSAPATATHKGGLSSKFGLFSIRERMKALGGTFEIESASGRGTTATLVLPLRSPAESKVLTCESEYQEGPHMAPSTQHVLNTVGQSVKTRVLLVDDHAMVRQGLRSVLECYADVEVVGEACNGEEAVASAERLRPAIVIMDINMPKMNGIEATARIKAQYPDITVIGLSVNVGGENQEAMLNAGAALLLTKEMAVEQLYGAIQEQMKQGAEA